jgi:hypothetical protein
LLLLVGCGLIASASAQSNFNRFTFNGGGLLGIGRGDVASFVGDSLHGVVGAGMNFNRWFGVDAEYMYYNLDFRQNVKDSQGLAHQSGDMQSLSLDGIINIPRHFNKFGAYGIFGAGFYRRTVSVPKHFLPAGADFEPAYKWFDLNYGTLGEIEPQYISSNTKDAVGFNYGGGLTYGLNHLHNAKIYVELRYHRAYHSDGQTIVMPVTLGLRW